MICEALIKNEQRVNVIQKSEDIEFPDAGLPVCARVYFSVA